MSNLYEKSANTFPFLCGVGIALTACKLLDLIDWSWWIVTLPFWVLPLASILFVILFYGCFALFFLVMSIIAAVTKDVWR